MELEQVPVKVDIFGVDWQDGTVLDDWVELSQIQTFDVLVIIGQLLQEYTDLSEDSDV